MQVYSLRPLDCRTSMTMSERIDQQVVRKILRKYMNRGKFQITVTFIESN